MVCCLLTATNIEGVFRIGGSEKRMKELTEVFDTPPSYGRNVDWSRYSVHDAASLLRRYLNQMPEPIIPLDLYAEFRNVITSDRFEQNSAVRTYRLLITSCPPANQYLLLYVLDLLAVFAHKSDVNKMSANNLAIIFQPGLLSHPSIMQSKDEHQVAIRVLGFLITHQQHFVLALSPPPPPNLQPEQLTVARPVANDVTIYPSDSDEEQGEMVAHTGGGAYLQYTGRLPSIRHDTSLDETSIPKSQKSSLKRSNTAPTRRRRDEPRRREPTSGPMRNKSLLSPNPAPSMMRTSSASSWTERLPAKDSSLGQPNPRFRSFSQQLTADSPRHPSSVPSRSPRLGFLSPSTLANGFGQVPGFFKVRSPRSERPDALANAGAEMAQSTGTSSSTPSRERTHADPSATTKHEPTSGLGLSVGPRMEATEKSLPALPESTTAQAPSPVAQDTGYLRTTYTSN